ncbi:hypothetical protein BpHYR1_039832 [Brachionus plicatilis]|uniref:Uncharacterized protein n=1 Tax=Brachionus plicatilis TaxID=10195 RepID=A0A3M7PFJ1_BRAPC|nr:hypothetical protein BpHYR1_039832 [Brachionus plicatilis]
MACMNRLMELCGSVSMSARRALVSSCRIATQLCREVDLIGLKFFVQKVWLPNKGVLGQQPGRFGDRCSSVRCFPSLY